MIILQKLRISGNTAYLESAPPFVAGRTDLVQMEVTFDAAWDGFSPVLLVEQAGSEIRWRLIPDENGRVTIPAPLTEVSIPFFLWAEGAQGESFLRTHSVCIAPEPHCKGDGEEGTHSELLPVYAAPYRVTKNGVYPTGNHFLTEDLTVDVPPMGTDTSMDTVTSATLLAGVTAHDAREQAIVGVIPTYDGERTLEITSPEGITLPAEGTYFGRDVEILPVLQALDAAENGEYLPQEGFAGIGSVSVNVQPPLQEKTVVANGAVTPDQGFYGLSRVEVQVPAQGIAMSNVAYGENVVCLTGHAVAAVTLPTISMTASATGELS